MLKNYLKTAVRNLLKNKTVSLINIFGLAVGLAAFIIIISYAQHELSFDRFHSNGEMIYRCIVETRSENHNSTSPQIVAAIGPALGEEIAGIDKVVRFRCPEHRYLGYENVQFFVKDILYADSGLFDVFSFRLIQGDSETALDHPYSVVLAENTALKMFGTTEVIGKMISLDNKDLLTVTGVVEDAPSNSHIQYNAFISFSTLYRDPNMHMGWNGGNAYYTYIKVSDESVIPGLTKELDSFMDLHFNSWLPGSWSMEMYLQPLHRIYMHSNLQDEIGPIGNPGFLILLFFIAILIFLIALINFINLTSVRLITRLRENGVRKVLGATRIRIVFQFISESFIMIMIALLLAFIFAESFMPVINRMLDQNLTLYSSDSFFQMLGILFLVVLAGTVAGAYPALYLTGLGAVESLRNALPSGTGRISFRRATVLLQYTASIAMIICSVFLYKQLHFMRHTDPGFERNNVLIVPIPTKQVSEKHDLLKKEFSKIPGVECITVTSDYPGRGLTSNGYKPQGIDDYQMVNVLDGDEDLVNVLGLKIVAGRNFSPELETDRNAYLINESLAKSLNWDNPLGKTIERDVNHEIIGVFRDFNFASLRENIAPLILSRQYEGGRQFLLIRVRPDSSGDLTKLLEENWNKLAGEVPFEYFYLDDAVRKVYDKEQRLSGLVLLFTILAIAIAFLGLFGLSTYETERQTKNIGIRKVNGARSFDIFFRLVFSSLKWVAISFVIACPLAFMIMSDWLNNFAYRAPMSLWVYLVAGMSAMAIATGTVGWKAWDVSRRNPVESLRYE